jgi:hypothetical protein
VPDIKNYEIRAKSTFIIDKFGLHSKHYRNFERDGDQIKKDVNVRPTGQQVDSLNRLLAITNVRTSLPILKSDADKV